MSVPSYTFDDDLIALAQNERRAQLRVYAPQKVMIVLGRGSQAGVEIDEAACRADDVAIFRRRGGGCAVVLDPGNVIVSLALPAEGLGHIPREMQRLSEWLVTALHALGISGVLRAGTSDLAIAEQKVGGSCLYRSRSVLFFSASLLVDPDLALMMRYLRHPPREPQYRRSRNHAAFVGRLRNDTFDSAEKFACALRRVLQPPESVAEQSPGAR